MKLLIPAAALLSVVMLSSCASMYRSGQTPDDVYYSPGRASDLARNQYDDESGRDSYLNPDDNYLRRKVQNRSRWSTIDDADYWYSYNRPYNNWMMPGFGAFGGPMFGNGLSIGFGNALGWGSPWGFGNPYAFNSFGGYPFWDSYGFGYPGGFYGYPSLGGYYGHGFYGGGYYPGGVIVGGGRGLRSNTGPKPYMGGFTNNSFNNSNNTQGRRDSRLGSFMRNTFSNGNNNNPHPGSYDNNSGRPARTFTPATSSPSYSPASSSRGSVGGSSGGSRPTRGGR